MLYAIREGKKIRARPGQTGVCSCCDQPMIPKCGQIKIWHWAHKTLADCDSWHEGETDWHLEWKSQFEPAWAEIRLQAGDKWHRADIRTPNGIVIEFQHSAIAPETIAQREAFYNNMVWVIDAREPFEAGRIGRYLSGYKWQWPRRSLESATRPLLLDIGRDKLLYIKRRYSDWTFKADELNRLEFIQRVTHHQKTRVFGYDHGVWLQIWPERARDMRTMLLEHADQTRGKWAVLREAGYYAQIAHG